MHKWFDINESKKFKKIKDADYLIVELNWYMFFITFLLEIVHEYNKTQIINSFYFIFHYKFTKIVLMGC